MRKSLAVIFALVFWTALPQAAKSAPSLEGDWVASWINDASGYFRQFSRSFHGNVMTATTKTVIDHPTSGTYAIDIQMTWTFALKGATGQDGIWDIDLVADKVLLIPQSQSAAGFFSNVAECGIVDWQVGVARDVSGRVCQETGPEDGPWYTHGSAKSYEIIGIYADHIRGAYLEDDLNYSGIAPTKRPRQFTPYVFERQ